MATICVQDIMTSKVRTMRADDTVAIADWLLAFEETHIIVVDGLDHVIGMFTDRDVLRAFSGNPLPSVPVSRIMTRDVHTLAAHTPATEAAERMVCLQATALPVTDESGCLLGLVTASDFMDVARWVLFGLDARKPAWQRRVRKATEAPAAAVASGLEAAV
jgi:CBS domain-containing protein